MLKRISLLLSTLSFLTLLQAQPSLTHDQQRVQQTISNFFEALSDRDSLSLKSYSTPDLTLFEYGEVWTLDTLIRKAISRNTATDFKRVNTIDFITTSVEKRTAWATYKLHSEITREGKHVTLHWLETVVVVKERKRWKIKLLHSTLVKRS